MSSIPEKGPGGKPARHNPIEMVKRIRDLSVPKSRQEDTEEWELVEWELVELNFEPGGRCLCNYYPITERFVIRNRKNGNTAVVGNICVTCLLGVPAAPIIVALRRVMKDPAAPLSAEAVEYAHRWGWINNWEIGFYLNTIHKIDFLSPKQLAIRVEINTRVLQLAREGGAGCLL